MSEPGTPRSERLFWHIMALVMTGVAFSTALIHDPPASITFWLAALVFAFALFRLSLRIDLTAGWNRLWLVGAAGLYGFVGYRAYQKLRYRSAALPPDGSRNKANSPPAGSGDEV